MRVATAIIAVTLLTAAAVEGKFFHHNAAHKHFDPVPEHIRARLDHTSSCHDSFQSVSLADALAATPSERAAMRERAKVTDLPGLVNHNGAKDVFAYSGYVLADAANNGNLFYWFFEAQDGNKNAPVLMWLQGGPGGSSMFGLLAENGPYSLSTDLQLVPRNITWNEHYAMLYVDNPVGVGFSFVDTDSGYSRDELSVAENLYTGLQAFFAVYDQYAPNDFYITGESYAGKYIPATSYRIYQGNTANPPPAVPINLVGLAIGDGWTDPRQQIQAYAELAWNFGLADDHERRVMHEMGMAVVRAIDAQDWAKAAAGFESYVDGPPDYFQNVTGCSNYYDTVEPSYGGNEDAYLNQTAIRAALHVGNHYYDINSGYAGFLLTNDLCKSEAYVLPTLFENFKVMLYNGQFDFIVGAALTEAYLPTIRWSGAEGLAQAQKIIWKINSDDVDVAGYARQYQNFSQVVVRGAGHILPFDQPARAFDMITRFVENIPFSD